MYTAYCLYYATEMLVVICKHGLETFYKHILVGYKSNICSVFIITDLSRRVHKKQRWLMQAKNHHKSFYIHCTKSLEKLHNVLGANVPLDMDVIFNLQLAILTMISLSSAGIAQGNLINPDCNLDCGPHPLRRDACACNCPAISCPDRCQDYISENTCNTCACVDGITLTPLPVLPSLASPPPPPSSTAVPPPPTYASPPLPQFSTARTGEPTPLDDVPQNASPEDVQSTPTSAAGVKSGNGDEPGSAANLNKPILVIPISFALTLLARMLSFAI